MASLNPKDMSRTGGSKRQRMVNGHQRPPKDEGFTWLSMSCLMSPAFTTLSVTAYRVFFRLAVEHGQHRGQENGKLRVSHAQFRAWGCTGDLVADAIEELVFKGLVKVHKGRAADGTPYPSVYRLTHLGDHEGAAPTNDWKKVTAEDCVRWSESVRAQRSEKRKGKTARQKKARSVKSESSRSVNKELGAKLAAA